jgi:hypothetical protein
MLLFMEKTVLIRKYSALDVPFYLTSRARGVEGSVVELTLVVELA